MIVVRILIGFIIPLAIILIPIITLLMASGKGRGTDRGNYLLAALASFLFDLFGPILATIISTHGLSFGSDPSDLLCVTGAGIFIFFGYLITLLGVPIVAIVRYPPKRMLS